METTDFRRSFPEAPDQPDIVVAMRIASGARFLLDFFAEAVARGTRFRAGETVQVGWMTLLLKETADGALDVHEPRLGSMPVAWARGAHETYRHLMLQDELCRQLGVEPDYPSLRQSGIVSPQALTQGVAVAASRDAPGGSDSGWVFRDAGYDGADGRLLSLFEIASALPAIVVLLALPAGAAARIEGRHLAIACGGKSLSTADNEFLRRLADG